MNAIVSPIRREEKLYVLLSSLFVTILVLTNIIGTKLFVLTLPEFLYQGLSFALQGRELTLTTGILTYPLTFWFTDVVSEIYGKKRADLMVFYGFLASLLMLGIITVARAVPAADIWRIGPEFAQFFNPKYYAYDAAGKLAGVQSPASQAAYSFTFDAPGILLFSSMLAYLTAQLTDNYLFHFWRRVTKGKHLWLRNNGSTSISQLLDTIIVNSIFLHFYWKLPWNTILEIILSVYVVKLFMALMDTPLIYLGTGLIKKYLGINASPRSEQEQA